MKTDLSEEDMALLDIILNLRTTTQWELEGFYIKKENLLTKEELNESLNKLSEQSLISTKKEQYQILVSMTQEQAEKARKVLKEKWEAKGINGDNLIQETERDFMGILKLLGLKTSSDGKIHVSFSDYYWDSKLIHICERLCDKGFFFKHAWSSRKHSYTSFYFRQTPINVVTVLEDFILRKISPEGLKLDTDWRSLVICIFSEQSVKVDDIKLNLPELTSDEVGEILLKLEDRGIITQEAGEIRVNQATKDMLRNYFLVNEYQRFRATMTKRLRDRIAERPTNLFMLGLIQKILTSTRFRRGAIPFYSIKRNFLNDISEENLREAAKLGIMFVTSNELIIAHEVLFEIEEILRGALSRKSEVITIPAGDVYGAIMTWRNRVFGKCEEYVKVQDEYVDEKTLYIIQSYTNPKTDVMILTSIKGAWNIDIQEVKERILALKRQGRKVELVFIGYEDSKEAPFHKRYIISKDVCFSLSGSIKGVAKKKDIDLIPIPKHEKQELIEPAFDNWFSNEPSDRLKKKGIIRMNFDEWVTWRLKS